MGNAIMERGGGHQQTRKRFPPDMLTPSSWTSQPPELWEMNACILNPSEYGIFYIAAWARTSPI
jgi:hypothetical protein